MITIRQERGSDFAAREKLLDDAFGAAREAKTSERLREGRLPAEGLSFVATEAGPLDALEHDVVRKPLHTFRRHALIGTVRLWDISAGPGRPALLLGPLAVEATARKRGIGAALVARALDAARKRGHGAVLLVGDAPYYGRFGFSAGKTGALWLPGAYEPHRLLGLELVPGTLDGARGMMTATGRPEPKPDLSVLVAGVTAATHRAARRDARRAA